MERAGGSGGGPVEADEAALEHLWLKDMDVDTFKSLLFEDGGGRRAGAGAALRAAGLIPQLLELLGASGVPSAPQKLEVLRLLAEEGGDEVRSALLDAGAVQLLSRLLKDWIGSRPRESAVDAICRAASIIATLAAPTERARGRSGEVAAAGGVSGLVGLLHTAFYCSWLLEAAPGVASAAEAALNALGDEHRRSGGAGPLLSANELDALRRMEEDEEGGPRISRADRAAAVARLLARLA